MWKPDKSAVESWQRFLTSNVENFLRCQNTDIFALPKHRHFCAAKTATFLRSGKPIITYNLPWGNHNCEAKPPSGREVDFAKQKTEGECDTSLSLKSTAPLCKGSWRECDWGIVKNQKYQIKQSLTRLRRELLAAARSQNGSDNNLGCHSTPFCRFATSRREPF